MIFGVVTLDVICMDKFDNRRLTIVVEYENGNHYQFSTIFDTGNYVEKVTALPDLKLSSVT